MRFRTLALGSLLVALTSTVASSAALLSPLVVDGERYFRVEWQAANTKGGPEVYGRIRNEWGFGARKVRLLVDNLDGSGAVTAQTLAYLPFELAPGTGSYFAAHVPPGAASYRVSVFDWEWIQAGGSDMVR